MILISVIIKLILFFLELGRDKQSIDLRSKLTDIIIKIATSSISIVTTAIEMQINAHLLIHFTIPAAVAIVLI